MPKVLLHNCQEASNIGNGFFDRTLKSMISGVSKESELYDGQELPHLVWRNISGYKKDNTYFYGAYGDVDYFVFAGPMIWSEVTSHYGPYFRLIKKNHPHAKFVFLNMGGMVYSEPEKRSFLELIRELSPHAISCRDDPSYELLKNECNLVHRGIDAAFFLSKEFKTYSTTDLGEYFTLCFDHSNEPFIDYGNLNDLSAEALNREIRVRPFRLSKRLRAHIESFRSLPAEIQGRTIIRPQHGLIDVSAKQIFCKPNTFISEQAPAYINLYSNTSFTISDRVHACVATLSFGGAARLIAKTGRSSLFDRVGLGDIRSKFVELDRGIVDDEYSRYQEFLRKVF